MRNTNNYEVNKIIKIEKLKNYIIPYCGNKRIQPYGDLVISDGENRKTCKIQDDGAKQYITFNLKRYYVRNAGSLYSSKFVIIGSIEDATERLKGVFNNVYVTSS